MHARTHLLGLERAHGGGDVLEGPLDLLPVLV